MENRIQNLKSTKYGIEGTMECPLFQTEMDVAIDNEEDVEYAQKCADYLCNMPQDTLLRLCQYIIRYCEDYREFFDDEVQIPVHVEGVQIIEYFVPSVLIVEKPDDPSIIGFHVECGCDWEVEHGLEFTIKDNKILYTGPFDAMPAWDQDRLEYAGFYDSDSDFCMNYADKEE